jgi:hypothetical protein
MTTEKLTMKMLRKSQKSDLYSCLVQIFDSRYPLMHMGFHVLDA